jgi:hypothetical protein
LGSDLRLRNIRIGQYQADHLQLPQFEVEFGRSHGIALLLMDKPKQTDRLCSLDQQQVEVLQLCPESSLEKSSRQHSEELRPRIVGGHFHLLRQVGLRKKLCHLLLGELLGGLE